MVEEPDIDSWQAAIEERAAQARALADSLAALTASARSRDGLIEVSVDSTGGVTDLRLDEGIRRHSARHTAAAILTTIAAARSEMAVQASAAVAATLGTESETGRAVLASFQRFRADG